MFVMHEEEQKVYHCIATVGKIAEHFYKRIFVTKMTLYATEKISFILKKFFCMCITLVR